MIHFLSFLAFHYFVRTHLPSSSSTLPLPSLPLPYEIHILILQLLMHDLLLLLLHFNLLHYLPIILNNHSLRQLFLRSLPQPNSINPALDTMNPVPFLSLKSPPPSPPRIHRHELNIFIRQFQRLFQYPLSLVRHRDREKREKFPTALVMFFSNLRQ